MVKLIQLSDGGWEMLSAAKRDALATTSAVFCTDAEHPSCEDLAKHGIRVEQVPPEGLPDGALLLIPPTDGALGELRFVVDRLLGPGGCPWDQAQTHESLKRYLLEEAYEVIDAIDSGSDARLKEELGDLLLQPYMHAQMRRQAGGWGIDDVARDIVDKLVRRHPHVFAELSLEGADAVLQNWDRLKLQEKGEEGSRLGGVPKAMAALLRAYETSKRASRAGFEWPNIDAVFEKLREEEGELREAIVSGDHASIEHEVGDLLFTVVNIARWTGTDPEEALRKMVSRFGDRFKQMESLADKPIETLSAQEWDDLWELAKTTKKLAGDK